MAHGLSLSLFVTLRERHRPGARRGCTRALPLLGRVGDRAARQGRTKAGLPPHLRVSRGGIIVAVADARCQSSGDARGNRALPEHCAARFAPRHGRRRRIVVARIAAPWVVRLPLADSAVDLTSGRAIV
jgi:hypothetical protein